MLHFFPICKHFQDKTKTSVSLSSCHVVQFNDWFCLNPLLSKNQCMLVALVTVKLN